MHVQRCRSGRVLLDARQHTHPFGDLHRRTEQVDGVAAGFAQYGRAFHDGHVEAALGQPVGQYRAGDAGARNQDPHDKLPLT